MIDSLISKTQRKMELLKEYRQSLISEVVTKGLNPNAEMKDSGVEWIGEIPNYWVMTKTKYYFNGGMGETILSQSLVDEGLPVWSSTEQDKYFGYVNDSKLKLFYGDLVIPGRGVSIGFVKRVYEPSTATQTTIYLKKFNEINHNFVYYLFIGFRKQFFFYSRTSIPQITVQEVQNNPIITPPYLNSSKSWSI